MLNKFKFDLNKKFSKTLTMGSMKQVMLKYTKNYCIITLDISYDAVYGIGERFNHVNQKNLNIEAKVYEKFCNQGKFTYCPIPFFFTNTGIGVFIDTYTVTEYEFKNSIKIKLKKDSNGKFPIIYFFKGTPKEIVESYSEITGKPLLPPKWAFGIWMSANRWDNEKEVETQVLLHEKYNLPANVMVLEAWSDEATFYRWNSKAKWSDPKKMIDNLHNKGIHLILWQIPVIKKMPQDQYNEELENDWKYAIENKLCIFNDDGSPYTIPEDHWFGGSLVPDFTNKETVKWWFSKRKHLLDIGIDGFKTDGGEFILKDNIIAHNGYTGLEMKNAFVKSYMKEYRKFIGDKRVLFSRAGYTGQQNYSIQWAGDQVSTWEEFRHVLVAGLSIGLSGVPYWGFDIGGFSGPLPSVELYERATQMAVFTPIMQWHSEPLGGQFNDSMSIERGDNDRSPWNIAKFYKDEGLISRLKFHYNLRSNLLPYLYDQAIKSSKTGLPMMKHLILEYPNDKNVLNVEDSFMLGDILVSPIVYEGQYEKKVYLPEGSWIDLWSGKKRIGGKSYIITCGKERIPVFLREGCCIALNLSNEYKIGSSVGNNPNSYCNLCFYITGIKGKYHFMDNLGNNIYIEWKDKARNVKVVSGNVKYHIISTIN